MKKEILRINFITRLTKDDESCLTDPKEVLEEQRRFYSKLYSSQNPCVNDPRFNLLFTGNMIKTLDNEQKESCEGLLTVEECKEALNNFSKNKSPGTDGLTAEFYSFFCNLLSDTMVNSFNYGFQKGKLTVSQRQSIIRLILKKDKDLSRLKNFDRSPWPQTGYMEGRFIGENIRLISDILHFTAQQNLEDIALFIDFEKAFDSLEWDFLLKTLDTFQFGHDFKSWVKILYTNITSCTINNGYASNWFELHHGVRQGGPLSGLLFVLAVEILSIAIRASRDIKESR